MGEVTRRLVSRKVDAYNALLTHLSLFISTMAIRVQTSAAGILALLSDPEPALKQHALKALLPLVPQFWAEISEHVTYMYVLFHSLCVVFRRS